MTRRIEQNNQIIENKHKEIELKENIELNREAWKTVYESVVVDRKKIETMDLRRLFIPLVKFVTIDKNHHIEYRLRIDNKKRTATNQFTF